MANKILETFGEGAKEYRVMQVSANLFVVIDFNGAAIESYATKAAALSNAEELSK